MRSAGRPGDGRKCPDAEAEADQLREEHHGLRPLHQGGPEVGSLGRGPGHAGAAGHGDGSGSDSGAEPPAYANKAGAGDQREGLKPRIHHQNAVNIVLKTHRSVMVQNG